MSDVDDDTLTQTTSPLEELDPTGRSAGDPGAKLDAGKPRVGLMLQGFPRALLEVAKVPTFGSIKYTPGGWQYVPNGQDRYDDAKGRHLLQGYIEDIDPETDLKHMAQEAWNALAKLELKLREEEARNGPE